MEYGKNDSEPIDADVVIVDDTLVHYVADFLPGFQRPKDEEGF